MNLLFVCQSPVDIYAGGVQHITYKLANACKAQGHVSFFLSVRKTSNEIPNQYYLPNPDNILSFDNRIFFKHLLEELKINLIINQCGIDFKSSDLIFECALYVPVITCFHNSLLDGVKNFYHLHKQTIGRFRIPRKMVDNGVSYRLIRKIYIYFHKKGYRKICERSAKVILLTEAMRHELKCFLGNFEPRNVEIIPNFVSIPNSVNYNKEKQIIYVGRIDRLYKQTDLAIRIWKEFSLKHSDYVFHIIGEGKDLNYVKQLSTKLGCENIVFEGKTNPTPFYKKASVLLFTSCSESFGIVLIEAMSHGVVPIAFDSYAAIREIIDDNTNGFLIKPFEIPHFVSKMNELIEDDEKRVDMAQKASIKSKSFSDNEVMKKWINTIMSI